MICYEPYFDQYATYSTSYDPYYEPRRDSYLPERRCQTVYADSYPCYSSSLGYSPVYNTYSRPCRYRQWTPLDPLSSCVNVAIFATLAFGTMVGLNNRY